QQAPRGGGVGGAGDSSSGGVARTARSSSRKESGAARRTTAVSAPRGTGTDVVPDGRLPQQDARIAQPPADRWGRQQHLRPHAVAQLFSPGAEASTRPSAPGRPSRAIRSSSEASRECLIEGARRDDTTEPTSGS